VVLFVEFFMTFALISKKDEYVNLLHEKTITNLCLDLC
jgi:hypothetical protein